MPQVVNGCGTWYWGKREITTREDFCEFCNRLVTLKSYDTTKCVVIFFLPVVPLGKKRILDECPACKRHRAMPLKDWRRTKSAAMSEMLGAWRRQKHDLDAAKNVIAAAMLFQDEAAFDKVTAEMGQLGADDPKFMAALGSAHEYFNRLQPAEEAYRTALARENTVPARNSLILNLLRQSRPDDAWPLLEEIIAQQDQSCTELLQAGVESFQALGKHDNALYVINASVAAFPHLQKQRAWKKLKKQSERHYRTGKSLTAKALTPTKATQVKEHPWLSTVGKFVMPALLLLGLIAFVNASYQAGRHREVFVVNGLPVNYTAEIAGQTVKLRAMGRRRIEVPEGEVTVRVPSAELNIPDQTCRFESELFSRLFVDRTVIINPDRAALILWEETEYAVNPDPNDSGDAKLHVGALLTAFRGVDFPFQPFPDSLSLPGGDSIKKQRVDHISDMTQATTLTVLADRVDQQAALEYFARLPLREPHEEVTLGAMQTLVSANALLAQLKPRLDDRPARIEAHRFYQELMGRLEPEHDLVAEYRRMLAADPDDHALMYLCARVLEDRRAARDLFERAATADPPCIRAVSALAYAALAKARFAAALEHARRAVALAPQAPSLHALEAKALTALGKYEELLAKLEQPADADMLAPFGKTELEVCTLVMLGRVDDADARIRALEDEMGDLDAETSELMFARLRSTRHYLTGDLQRSIELLQPYDIPPIRFVAAMSGDDIPAATAALSAIDGECGIWYLLVYAHNQVHDSADADDFRVKAVPALRREGSEKRRMADWLAAGELADVNEPLLLAMDTQEKAVCLTALAARFPEHRAPLAALAEKLNFDRRFPHREIADILDRMNKTSAGVPASADGAHENQTESAARDADGSHRAD